MDKITISISPEQYKMRFVVGEKGTDEGTQFFVQKDKVRAGTDGAEEDRSEEYVQLKDSRKDLVQEKIVRNNAWMKDISRDEVDAKKTEFKQNLETPKKAESLDQEHDADMLG